MNLRRSFRFVFRTTITIYVFSIISQVAILESKSKEHGRIYSTKEIGINFVPIPFVPLLCRLKKGDYLKRRIRG